MRQRSLVGPVILIGLGILFLINNVRPDFSFWRDLGRYWPFLIILFGVLRLAEVLLDAGRGKPLAVHTRGGGTGIGLLIFLCVIFWLVGHNHGPVHLGNWNNGSLEVFGDQFDYPISGRGSASGVTLLVLDNLRGNVTITGGEGDEYTAEGRKTIRAYDKRAADDADRRSAVRFMREGNQLVVKTDDSGISGDRRVATDLDLKVPRGVSVEARGRSGDVTVTSISGSVDVSSDRGDVRLSDVGGNAKLAVGHSGLIRVVDARGSLDLEGRGSDIQAQNIDGQVTVNGSYSGTLEFKNLSKPLHFESPQTDLRVEKLPGSLTLDLSDLRANNITGPMRLHTKSRDIHIEDFSDSMELDLDRGDIDLSESKMPSGKIDAHTRNGNIELALPDRAAFDLKATAHQGEAHNDYGPAVRVEMDGRTATLRSVDGRGPAVVLTTERGAVSLRKSGASQE